MTVHPKTPIPTTLLAVATFQSGVISRAQALEYGVGRHAISRLLRDGQWHSVVDGVYSRSPSPDWTALAWTGLLLAGDGGALGAHAAMHLHGVGEPPDIIKVWSGRRRLRNRDPWRFREGTRAARGSPSRVSLEDATLEVCAETGLDGVVAALAMAVTSRRTTVARLRSRALMLPNLRHRKLVLESLCDVSEGAESPLERRYLHEVERAHGLPVGLRQISISRGTIADVAYVEHRVLVELDGRLGHWGNGAFRDAARDNRHAVAGFVTLRFGWNEVVGKPCAVAAQVAEVLAGRGWSNAPRQCRHCTI